MRTSWIAPYMIHIIVAIAVWIVAFYLLGKETRQRLLRPNRINVHPRSVVDTDKREAYAPLSIVTGRHFEVFYSTIGDTSVTYRNINNNEIFFVICGEALARVFDAKTDELVIEKMIRAHGCSASPHGEDLVAHALEGQYITLRGTSKGTRVLCLVVPPYSEMMQIIGTLDGEPDGK